MPLSHALLPAELSDEAPASLNPTINTRTLKLSDRVTWQCSVNSAHIWTATLRQRLRGAGCPHCRRHQQALLPGSLSASYPALLPQWDARRNPALNPDHLSTHSSIPITWHCPQIPSHLWQSTIAQQAERYRQGQPCPICARGWSTKDLRLFLQSLLPKVSTLSPAELYVIFQQAGLTTLTGAKGHLIAALLERGIPATDLARFCEGDRISVEDLLSVRPAEQNGTPRHDLRDSALPRCSVKEIFSELDHLPDQMPDDHAAEFLVASAVQKLWRLAFQNSTNPLEDVEHSQPGHYSALVRDRFLEEYRGAMALPLPPHYSFTVDGVPTEPNLMQRLTAFRLHMRRRIGSWSGTGAGKTLAGLLASRVVQAHTTLIICPNNVIDNVWMSSIRNAFASSHVITRRLDPAGHAADPVYYVLHYEWFQTQQAEEAIRSFMSHTSLDCIIIDEIHLARVRYPEDLSLRRQRLNRLTALATAANPKLSILALSATPVVNSLEEPKSLIELITGTIAPHLDTAPTVANCMRMHQALTLLGLRWVPDYNTQLHEKIIPIDCTPALDRISQLPKRHGILPLEQELTKHRLPVILSQLKPHTIVYSYYVDGIIDTLEQAIQREGWTTCRFTGEDHTGVEPFLSGRRNILLTSNIIATGIDGLQKVCNRVIINTLPWTAVEYRQLCGRLYRQGQAHDVDLIIPKTYAVVSGNEWSWCQARLDRIRFKQTLADAVVDGIIPEDKLRSPNQVYQDVMQWIHRLQAMTSGVES